MEKLREYVRSVMAQKGLSVPDIAKQSGGTIKASYIFDILSGKTKYISVDKLNALALGLGVDSVELFKVASGYSPSPDPALELIAILKILTGMSPKERTTLLARLRKK
jgi:transcriptional regulator with XRE-family HTH domain